MLLLESDIEKYIHEMHNTSNTIWYIDVKIFQHHQTGSL